MMFDIVKHKKGTRFPMTDATWPDPAIDPATPISSTPTMVFGIIGASLGVLIGWFLPLIPLALGIVGLLLVRKAEKDGKRTAGLVLGIVNTTLGGLGTLWWVAVALLAASSASSGYYA